MDKKTSIKETTSSILLTLLGVFIYSFAITAFIIPSGFISGGYSGLATILYYVNNNIRVGLTVFVLNIITLIIAYKIMGKRFVLLTLIGVTFMSLVLLWLQPIFEGHVIMKEAITNAIMGGVLSGLGLGIAFNAGGNTGGTDIITLIINKYKNISPGTISLSINSVILLLLFIVNHFVKDMIFWDNIEIILYGLVVMGTTSYTLDFILTGNRQSYQFVIMSNKYEEIADAITTILGRGVTLLDGKGWYKKNDMEILLVMVARNDKNRLLRIIKKIDPKAFLSVSKVQGVYGRNFDKIK
ncbi:MAG: YitT family protein [Bacteroidales bacterium]|jgi:uncharacterized membrane-anchored protein YitT (DUF2179 family)